MSSVATVPVTTDKLQRCLSLPPDQTEKSDKVGDTLIRIFNARNEAKTGVKLSKKGFSFDNAKEYSKQSIMDSKKQNFLDKLHSSEEDEDKVKTKKKKKRRGSLARPLNLHGIKAFSLDKSNDAKAAWDEEPTHERTKRNHILKRAFRKNTKRTILEETTELKPAQSLSSLAELGVKNHLKKQPDTMQNSKMRGNVKQVQDLSSINIIDKNKLDVGFFDKITKSPFISRKKTPISVNVIPSSTPVSPTGNVASVPSSPTSEHFEHINTDYHKSLSSWITGSVTLPRRFRNKKQRQVLIETPSSTESSLKSSPRLGAKENSASQNSIVETILGKNVTAEDILNDNYFASNLQSTVYWNEYGSSETVSSGDIPNSRLMRQSPVSDFESVNIYDQGYVTWDGRGGSTLPRKWKTNRRKENVSDSRENLREPAWINNVKNRVKKSSNAQKPPNMLINKLPSNYASSLPNSFSMQGQSRTLSTMELAQKFNNDGNSSETSEKRLSGYADDETISYPSGTYTPPSSSSQLSSMRENSSSAEHLGENLQYYSELRKDPDLSLGNDNPETWSMTVDKKLLRKMHKKDMKRQENIYEFFQKEQNFLTTLKIMQKIFAQGMRLEANVDEHIIHMMFPQIDEFVDYTQEFMVKLRERQEKRDDKIVDEIGDLLVEQWSGDSAKIMIDLFSQICCEQNEIVAIYKEMLKSDKKFNDFIETSRKNPLTRRRGIQECLLLVTQRITKYQIMVKSLIDNSSDKKYRTDVDNLQRALECITSITVAVNSRVQEYEKQQMLKKIWKSMESKVITYNETRKFSKDDLLHSMRNLEQYAHNIQWKSKESKKIVDVTMLLFTDCLVLLHESNQRYTFASNGQPAAVPLHKLIVRDIANEQQGFYLISAGSQVEMYTLFCESEESCKNWMQYIRTAAQNCPEEDEGIQTEEERKQEQKWIEAHAMINELEVRDKKINALLVEKMENFRKLAALSNKAELLENLNFRYPTYSSATNETIPPGSPVLLQAIEQVAKLTHAVHGPGGVARHPSSVGEGNSGTYIAPVLPKRSGTFGGFDNGVKEPPSSPKLKQPPIDYETESSKESGKRDSGLIMTDFTIGSPDINENELMEEKVTEPPAGKLPLPDHQVTSLAKLTHLLNQYLSIATQQDTQMEIMKLEMEQAKERSFTRRRPTSNLQEVEALRYKSKQQQQEQELNKQQTQLMVDKMAWNKEIERRQNTLDVTQSEVNERVSFVKKRESELEREQEEVKKMKDDLQREMARLRELQKRTQNQEQGLSTHTSVPLINHNNSNNQEHDINRHSSDVTSDKIYKSEFKSTSPTYQSASDYPRTFPVGKRESGVIFPPYNTIGGTSTSSLISQPTNLPIHLQYSATNQATALQHTNSQMPGKLSKLSKKSSAPNSVSNIHQVIPNKLSGLSKSGGVTTSKSSHNSKFAEGIKHKIPFGHSKHSKPEDNSFMKHSKSDISIENRLRPISAYESSTTEVDSNAVERSNSASSNSSKEGSDKKKKKHSSNESDKPRNKETKEVFYL